MTDDKTKILIVDDEDGIRSQLTLALEDHYADRHCGNGR